MKKGIRHGEVALIPTDARVTGKKVKKFIVAHSETGHHHVIESDTSFVVDDKQFLIELFGDAAIVHKKSFDADHATAYMFRDAKGQPLPVEDYLNLLYEA